MVSGWERNPDILSQIRTATQPSPLPFVNRSTPFTNPPRQLEPTAAQLDAQAQQRLRVQQGDNDLFGTRATQQPARPTRETVVNDLRRTGAGLRDIFTPYVEANLAGQAFSEGRVGAGVGWSALTAAGIIPFLAPGVRSARAPAAAARALAPAAPTPGLTPRKRTGPPEPNFEFLEVRKRQMAEAAQQAAEREAAEAARLERIRAVAEAKRAAENAPPVNIQFGPPRIPGPGSVRALQPFQYDSWRTLEPGRIADTLAAPGVRSGTIVPSFREPTRMHDGGQGGLALAIRQAFRESEVPNEILDPLIGQAILRANRGLTYKGAPRASEYDIGVAGTANVHTKNDIIADISRQLGVKPNPGYGLRMDYGAAARRFEDLEPAVALNVQALESILSSGRFRSGSELGRSRSLGALPGWQRIKDVEVPTFGAPSWQEGNAGAIYGFATGRPGTSPMPWENLTIHSGPIRNRNAITDVSSGNAYGNVVARFNPDVRRDTSFFFGDSVHHYTGRGTGLAGGVGRPFQNASPMDVAMAGGHRHSVAPYIETQTWRPPLASEISSLTAHESLHPQLRAILSGRGYDIPLLPLSY